MAAVLLVTSGCAAGWDDGCAVDSDCVLTTASCCRSDCFAYALDDAVAIVSDRAVQRLRDICAQPELCPACSPTPGPAALQPVCRGGRCVVRDLRDDPLSSCEVDNDCAIVNVDGCFIGRPWRIVALNPSMGSIAELGPEPCVVIDDLGATASCRGGRCEWFDPIGRP